MMAGCKKYTAIQDDGGDAPASEIGSDVHSSSDGAPDFAIDRDTDGVSLPDGFRGDAPFDGGANDTGVNDTGKAPASLHLSVASGFSYEFGSLAVGVSPPQTEQFVVKNTGEQNSSALTVSLTGTDFKLEAPTGLDCVSAPAANATTLEPNASCAVRVTFSPTAAMSRTATLSVSATAGGSDSLATLHGAGVMPSALTVSTPTVDLGSVLQGGKSNPATVITVRNAGDVLTGAISTSIPAGEFAIATDGCKGLSLATNTSCTIAVAFSPVTASATVKTSTLTVSASPGGSPTVALSGRGTTLTLDQTSFVFPATATGTNSLSRSFTVTNPTAGPAGMTTGLSVTLTGTSPADFNVDSTTCSGSLGGTGLCAATVSFRPSTFGLRTAVLTVSANAGGTVTAALSGQGQAADSTPGCVTELDCQSGYCTTYYRDADGDGDGDPKMPLNFCGFLLPGGYSRNGLDCNDSDALMHQNASRCQSSTVRIYCLGDAVLRTQTCPGGGCIDSYCVGSQNTAGSFMCFAVPSASGQLSTSLICSAPQVCISPPGLSSPACGAASAGGSAATCDDASDCASGQVCCRLFSGVEYARSCVVGACPPPTVASFAIQLCNPLAPDCQVGSTCTLEGADLLGGQGFWECS